MLASESASQATERPTAVVTGGKQGLGLEAVKHLASQGFNVVIADLQPEDQEIQVLRQQLSEWGAESFYIQCDISDIDRHAEMVDAIWGAFGRIDCLVNNAGVAARPLQDILELPVDAFDRSIDVNLRGTFFFTQEIARRMIASPVTNTYRSIIVVTSIAAEMPSVQRAQYSMTKAALSMMVKLFATRLAPKGIHVHEIRPGFIQTAMTASAGTSAIDDWIDSGRVPMPRWGKPEDVGQAIATLASGSLPYLTGQPMWVAGGLNLQPAP